MTERSVSQDQPGPADSSWHETFAPGAPSGVGRPTDVGVDPDLGLDHVQPRPAPDGAEVERRPLVDEGPSGLHRLDAGTAAVVVLLALAVAVPLAPLPVWSFLLVPVAAVAWVAALALTRAYEPRYLWSGSAEGRRVMAAGGAVTVGVLLVGWLWLPPALALPGLGTVGVLVLVTLVARWLVRVASQRRHREGMVRVRVLAVGPAEDVRIVSARIDRNRYHGWKVVAACTPDSGPRVDGPVRLGSPADVVSVASRAGADVVLLCPGTSVGDIEDLRQVQQQLEVEGRELAIAPPLVEAIGPRVSISSVCGLPVVRLGLPELTGPRRVIKAVADRFVSAVVLLVLGPLLLAVALAVRLDSKGPSLFRQVRVGRDGHLFSMVKFRTMYVDAEARKAALLEANEGSGLLFKLREDPRVTRVGRILRRTSLDELPQLVNILRGEMSFVGPRPSLPDEADAYDPFIRRRLLVTPGLTGLWQVHGRSDLSWTESRRLDVRYVENWSLGFDVSIILRTVEAVLRGRGAY
ncbi:sugar transferase [Aquipuribacter sp. MA13-6]|uniref:sugar transferase n=1 Tax=unclassified Aquipuribacter TaxID=2635084 RepID=UPI003EF07865